MSIPGLDSMRQLVTNARIAFWRRYRYRSPGHPQDFIFRSTSMRVASPLGTDADAVVSSLRTLRDPVYLRVSNSDFAVFEEIFDRDEYAAIKQWNLPDDATSLIWARTSAWPASIFRQSSPASIVAVEPDEENCRMLKKLQADSARQALKVYARVHRRPGWNRRDRSRRIELGLSQGGHHRRYPRGRPLRLDDSSAWRKPHGNALICLSAISREANASFCQLRSMDRPRKAPGVRDAQPLHEHRSLQ